MEVARRQYALLVPLACLSVLPDLEPLQLDLRLVGVPALRVLRLLVRLALHVHLPVDVLRVALHLDERLAELPAHHLEDGVPRPPGQPLGERVARQRALLAVAADALDGTGSPVCSLRQRPRVPGRTLPPLAHG